LEAFRYRSPVAEAFKGFRAYPYVRNAWKRSATDPPVAEAFKGFRPRSSCYYDEMPGYEPTIHTGRLQRLPAQHYAGGAFVHWVHGIAGRKTGWLTPVHHARFRELTCHVLHRFGIICPVFSLMPDHCHLLLIGVGPGSDQLKATRALRIHWAEQLREAGGFELERQAFDNVLSAKDRTEEAFAKVAQYVLRNPERKRLVADWRTYPYLGSMVPGFPALDPRDLEYWPNFWRIHRWLTLQSPTAL
jgi:putative transposase